MPRASASRQNRARGSGGSAARSTRIRRAKSRIGGTHPGSDHQVRIRQVARGHAVADERLVDSARGQGSCFDLACDTLHGGDEIVAAAVAQGERQPHFRPAGGLVDELEQRVSRGRGQVLGTADDADGDLAFAQLGHFAVGEVDEQAHQGVDFGARALPIREAEGVEGEVRHASLAASANDFAHGLGPLLVSSLPRHAALGCPSAVAIHDDRYVPRNRWRRFHAVGGARGGRAAHDLRLHHVLGKTKEGRTRFTVSSRSWRFFPSGGRATV